MRDEHVLVLVYALLYFWQCFHWFRPGAIVLLRRSDRLRVVSTDPRLESRLGSPVRGAPLPPFPIMTAMAPWPFSIDSERLVAFQERCWTEFPRPVQSADAILLDDIDTVEADGRHILINGERFTTALDEGVALDLVDIIGDTMVAPREGRAEVIREALAATLDVPGAKDALADLEDATRALRVGAQLLFAAAGILAPALILTVGLAEVWFWLLPSVMLLNVKVAFDYRRAHRRVAPELVGERVATFVTMLLFPPETMRAPDYVTRHALAGRHAFAVVDALGENEEGDRFLAFLLRDLQRPIPPIHGLSVGSEETVRFMRELETELVLQRITPERLESIKAVEVPSEQHCPRCLGISQAPTCDVCRLETTSPR